MVRSLVMVSMLVIASPALGADDVELPKPLTAEFLANIDEIPFGKMGARSGPAYAAIVREGLGVVPELIALLDDPTLTRHQVPLTGGYYAVGDVAMSAISSIVRGVPWLEFITSPDDPEIETLGFGVYWYHVRESPENRVQLQRKAAMWFRENEGRLVWQPIPDIASGGVFELRDAESE